MHLIARAFNLSRPELRSCTKQVEPKTWGGIGNKGLSGNKIDWGTLLSTEKDWCVAF